MRYMFDKEFEALKFIDLLLNARLSDKHFINVANDETWLELSNIKQLLTELQAIKNAEPSEALGNITLLAAELGTSKDMKFAKTRFPKMLTTIKQALLKAEKLEKAWEVVKEKCLYTDNLNDVATCLNYNYYKERMSKKYDTKVVKTDWNDKVLLDCLKLLTEEEFKLLKDMIE